MEDEEKCVEKSCKIKHKKNVENKWALGERPLRTIEAVNGINEETMKVISFFVSVKVFTERCLCCKTWSNMMCMDVVKQADFVCAASIQWN